MNTSITQALSAPFDPVDVKFKPATVSGTRALCIAYVNARAIMDRLDEVLTPAGWQDEYVNLPDGAVMCKLSCKLGDEWIVKCDVGGQSDQADEGDRMKAAFSDALKRAAVKFGCGRYLYRLPSQWCDYDPQKKQIKGTPQLPGWALPGIATNAAQPATKPAICAAPPISQHAVNQTGGIESNAVIHAQDLQDDDEPRDVQQAEQAATGRIDDAQEACLARLIRETRTDAQRVLGYFGIRSLGQLPAAQFQTARRFLERKAASAAVQNTQGGSAGPQQARDAAANGVGNPKGTPAH